MATPWEITLHLLLPCSFRGTTDGCLHLTYGNRSRGGAGPQPWHVTNAVTKIYKAETLITLIHSPLKGKQRHHSFSQGSLRTWFILRFVLATEHWAAAHKILPGGIWVKKIWSCPSKSLFSQVSIIGTIFLVGALYDFPLGAQLTPSRAARIALPGSDCSVHPPYFTLFTRVL